MDKYFNTYLKEEQSLYEIRNYKIDNKFPKKIINNNTLTNNDIEVILTVEFLKKELDNQKKINEELLHEIRKLQNEMPMIINSMMNFDMQNK